jgi:hypothetical protein
MYRLLTVAGPHGTDESSERRPLQLRLNDAHRELALAESQDREDVPHLRSEVQRMAQSFVDKLARAQRLEAQQLVDEAVELYEEAVTDMYEGSLPYERLLAIYEHKRLHGEAQRVARCGLAHAAASLSEATRALCIDTLEIPREVAPVKVTPG